MTENEQANKEELQQKFEHLTLKFEELKKQDREKEEELTKQARETEELKKQLEEWKKKNTELEQALKDQSDRGHGGFAQLPGGLVASVSAVAGKREAREAYYRTYLNPSPIRGGFVAHSFFVRFVKGAFQQAGEDQKGRKEAFSSFVNISKPLVAALKKRNDCSFLSESMRDTEAPQSLVASQLLSLALGVWGQQIKSKANPPLLVSHQGELKRDKLGEGQEVILNKEKEKKAVDYKVDVIASHVSQGMMKIVSVMEYKPDDKAEEARRAQRDMYSTNTMALHKRLCIGVDIAGGNDVDNWKMTAMAYFVGPKKKKIDVPKLECSEMYRGKGLEGLFDIAVGLHSAAEGWSDEDIEKERRLGPVVAKHGNRVYKAYVNATYRNPNPKIVRDMLEDTSVNLWASEDGKVKILEMGYRRSNWTGEIQSQVFVQILQKLQKLHGQGKVHGFGFFQGNLHVFYKMLYVKSRIKISIHNPRCEITQGPAASGTSTDRFQHNT